MRFSNLDFLWCIFETYSAEEVFELATFCIVLLERISWGVLEMH